MRPSSKKVYDHPLALKIYLVIYLIAVADISQDISQILGEE